MRAVRAEMESDMRLLMNEREGDAKGGMGCFERGRT
jgi:hypothetical protein